MEVAKFVTTHPADDGEATARRKKLGVTVSYPVDQIAATSGSAIKWKNFSVDDTAEFANYLSISQRINT